MATLLFYHSPIFSLILMRIGAEDQELGEASISLTASCWQGALYGAGFSGSCGVLDGAFTVVFRAVLERLVSMEVQLVKFLISKSRRAV
jgi:hypothetical protein